MSGRKGGHIQRLVIRFHGRFSPTPVPPPASEGAMRVTDKRGRGRDDLASLTTHLELQKSAVVRAGGSKIQMQGTCVFCFGRAEDITC